MQLLDVFVMFFVFSGSLSESTEIYTATIDIFRHQFGTILDTVCAFLVTPLIMYPIRRGVDRRVELKADNWN